MSFQLSLTAVRSTLFRRWLLFPGAAALFFAGCATEPIPTGSRLVISVPVAQFYKNGPAQDSSFMTPQTASVATITGQESGPDGQLPSGAIVTMVKREIGFSRVMTGNGTIGYVSNDQMQRAPAIARASTPPSWRQPATPRRQKAPQTRPPEEQLDLSDLPLPLPG